MGKSKRVLTLYDVPMWDSIAREKWELQKCKACGTFRYPPSPICAECHSMEYDWVPVAGTGTILSWTIFHKKYFDDFPPPYNTVAVRLDEGPIIVSNLVGPEPEGDWIDRRVEICYAPHEGITVPKVKLAD